MTLRTVSDNPKTLGVRMDTGLRGPWPTISEALTAVFGGEWEIWRDLRADGSHGEWLARRLTGTARPTLRAGTIHDLAEQLAGDHGRARNTEPRADPPRHPPPRLADPADA
ncbi:hypothetical protein GCM10027589_24150 [Actinocorallia lasiicapitis]